MRKPNPQEHQHGAPMTTSIPGAVEELSPRMVSPGLSPKGRVQMQSLGMSPLLYPHGYSTQPHIPARRYQSPSLPAMQSLELGEGAGVAVPACLQQRERRGHSLLPLLLA